MPATFEPIATTTLGSAAASITFSSIPATYTDLQLVFTWLGSGGESYSPDITFNNDTGSNYSITWVNGNGGSAGSSRESNFTRIESQNTRATTSIPSLYIANIFSYAGSTNKTTLLQGINDRNGAGVVEYVVGLWRNTSAITRIDLTANVSNFAAGTVATLYGITKAV